MDAKSEEKPKGFPDPLTISKVIAPIKYKRNVIRAIEDIGKVEPIEVDPRTGADAMEVEERRNLFENYRNRLQRYFEELDEDLIENEKPITLGHSEEEIRKFVEDVVENKGTKIEKVLNRIDEINERNNELKSILDLLEKFDRLDIDNTSMLKDTELVDTYLGTVFPGQMERLYWTIDEITDSRYFIIDRKMDNENQIVLLSVLEGDSQPVSAKLKNLNFQDVDIPKDVDLEGLSVADCKQEMEQLDKELDERKQQLDQLAKEMGNEILAALEASEIELQRISVEMKMRRTETTAVMWAWIPDEIKDEFKSKMHTATEGSATLDFRKGDFDPEYSPSKVDNSEFMEPMRGLVTSFGTPGHDEIDPYPFVKYLFPILFGIMFADFGHGLILTLIGVFFYRKKQKLKKKPEGLMSFVYGGAELMILMGAWSMLLGILMNSFFGDEAFFWNLPILPEILGHEKYGIWRFFFHVEHAHGDVVVSRNYINLLIFSLAAGAVVILLGLGLNVYQLYQYRHADYELYAALTLMAGYAFIITSFLAAMIHPLLLYVFIVLGVANLIGTLVIEGAAHGMEGAMLGVDHVLSLMSHTFSFGRLLAMNTIHFVLAFLPYKFMEIFGGLHVVNHSTQHWAPFEDPTLLMWWGIAAFIGSLIVVPVETVFSTLQSLRLNWVEFFGKFYDGEGVEFKPFGADRIYTQEQ